MRLRQSLIAAGLLGICWLAWAAPVTPPDPVTLQLVNEGRDDEQKLKPEQVKIVHAPEFEEATLVGYMAGPSSCLLGSVVLDGKLFAPKDACGVLLRKRGWETAAEDEKRRLAFLWLEHAQFAFGEKVVSEKPEGWVDRESRFKKPEFTSTLSGSARALVWVEEAPGMSSSRNFRRMLYWFASDGRLVRSKVVEHFQTNPAL